MSKFNDFYKIRIISEEYDLNEGYIMDLAKKLAQKYGLALTVILALVSGQGCSGQPTCPMPKVQEEIKQEFKKITGTSQAAVDFLPSQEEKQRFLPDQEELPQVDNRANFLPNKTETPINADIKQIGPNTYEVKGVGKVSPFGPNLAPQRAKNDAFKKLFKHLKIENADASARPLNTVKSGGNIIVTFEITVK